MDQKDCTELIEMPDGARLLLSAKGWQSDSRPSLANILNSYYPAEKDLHAQADRLARRFHWQLLEPLEMALNGVSSAFGTNTPPVLEPRSAAPALIDNEAF
jgi:hypothetical protein